MTNNERQEDPTAGEDVAIQHNVVRPRDVPNNERQEDPTPGEDVAIQHNVVRPRDVPAAAGGEAAPAAPPGTTREIARLLAAKHTELAAKGFSERIITASVERCLAYAQAIGSKLSPEIREAGTLDLLRADLDAAEQWCENYLRSMTD